MRSLRWRWASLRFRLYRARAYLRADPDAALELAAAEVLARRDVHVCLVSRVYADELRVWSKPLQVLIEPREGSLLVEMIFREVPSEVEA